MAYFLLKNERSLLSFVEQYSIFFDTFIIFFICTCGTDSKTILSSMKIAFVTPASNLHKTPLYRAGHLIYEPANSIPGPLILGKILTRSGHTVAVYEELYRNLPLKKILSADVIGISTMTSTAPRAYALADYFRLKGKRVILGGFHASALPEEAKRHCDQVIVGEAEGVITEVIDGTITEPIVRGQPITDLDSIPFPDYSLLRSPVTIANFMTTRGCPNTCSFCTTSRMFHPYREMSCERVIEAIRWYRAQGFSRVNIQDDNFTANKPRAKRILKMLIDNGLAFRETFFFGRIDVAEDEELVALLKKAGFRIILVGMESTNQKSLDTVNKMQQVKQIYNNATRLTECGMKLSASIILGLDFDTKQTIEQTVDFCRSIGAYSLQVPILTPFPGTPLYKKFKEEGRILTDSWHYYDMMHAVFQPDTMSPLELQNLFVTSAARFYSFGSIYGVFRRWGIVEALKRLGMALSIKCCIFLKLFTERKYYTLIVNKSISEKCKSPEMQSKKLFTLTPSIEKYSAER